MKIKIQKGKNTLTFVGRNAQALLALRDRGKKGLSHLDFQVNFDGGYRLSAYILELRDAGLSISDKWFCSDKIRNIRYKKYYLDDKVSVVG